MQNMASLTTTLIALFSLLAVPQIKALIPATPGEQTRRAIISARETISAIRSSGSSTPPRIYIDYLLPLPPETSDADIDPWPGGLAQMYPYAEATLKEILAGIVVDEDSSSDMKPKEASSQIISASDCCGLFIQESPFSPSSDVAALLFPGPDQLSNIQQIEEMVKDRTLILFNKQFTRAADFGFFAKDKAQKLIFDRYQWGFAFQELACRGEDVKLTFEQSVGWQACVLIDNGDGNYNKEIDVMDATWDRKVRPNYLEMEKKINEVLPEPLWMRKMGDVQEKGLKFQRK